MTLGADAVGGDGTPPVRRIDASEVDAFVRETLLSPDRTRPVVAVTTHPRDPEATVDPARLAADVGDVADVVLLETGEATWALSAALPSRLDVYGGAVRIWWPGLSPTSTPRDHPLLFCFARDETVTTARKVIALVRARAPRPARRMPPPPPSVPAHGPVQEAVVTAIEGDRVQVVVGDSRGIVSDADIPLEELATGLAVGESIQVRAVVEADGVPGSFSTKGVLQDPWARIERFHSVGDVIRGRVCRIEETYLLVEILPGAALLVPRSEVDWSRFQRPTDVFRVGETTKMRILKIDRGARRGVGSIKQGYATEPKPPIPPFPGQPPFLSESDVPTTTPDAGEDGADRNALAEELRSVVADRDELIRRLKDANEQLVAARKALRSAEARAEARHEDRLDPLASETDFLSAVRVEYARRFDEGSRQTHPLQRMRVGREFLARLRDLEGIDVSKVVEVCAQVACGRAHEVPGRAVHELRAGEKGASGRTRAADGAKAWRCSLQDGTPGARRLHWWDIPGAGGRTVEFASVAVHDDLSIPS